MHMLIPAALVLALAACGGKDKPAVTAEAAPPPPPQKTVIDPQLEALKKAKGVQDTVDKAVQEKDQQVKDAGG